jgi:hypothetical protein
LSLWRARAEFLDRPLTFKDIDQVTGLVEGDSRVALEVLKAIGLYGQVQPPSGPEDAELVLWAEAKERAEKEFKKQRPSIDPLLAFTLGEIEIPALAQERMEELWEQCHQ